VSGYVRIHRSLIGHADFRTDAEAMAFAWMVIRAAWQPTRVRYKGFAVSLQRGQLCVSQRDMADALERDKTWVERLWKRLRDTGMIETSREAAAMLITICNYNEYQSSRAVGEAAPQAADGGMTEADPRQTRGTEQRREEYKKDIPSESKDSSGARTRKADPFPCPDGVDPIDWDGLKANRKAKRSALSIGAHRQIMTKLEHWAVDGWPPGPIVACAAERGWTTVFETDEMKAGAHKNGNAHQIQQQDTPRDGVVRALLRQQAQRSAGPEGELFGPSGDWPEERRSASGIC
jgi:hypothetical protein